MSNGYEIQLEPKEQMINRSDQFGDMLIDTIYRGADWFCQYEAMEAWLSGVMTAISPFAALGSVGIIGRLGTSMTDPLVLTSTAGTPAAASPATLTANQCKLAPNSQPNMSFNSELRTVPTRLVFLPYDSGGGVIKHFTTT